MNNQVLLIISVASLVISLAALGLIALFGRRLSQLMKGRSAKSLEPLLTELHGDIARANQSLAILDKASQILRQRQQKSIQRVETVRFNPFRDQGGNHSFATAFLNDDGDGVVISTLYSRDKTGVYAKPVIGYQSEFELSDEERQAIDAARQTKR